jgi:invasion protein IalB
VRITSSLRMIAVAGLMGALCPLAALAQQNPPAAGQQNFGPRIKGAQPALPGAPQPGAAQQQPPAAETVATNGAWQVQCGTAQAADGSPDPAAKKQCGMVQITKSEKNEKIGLSLIIVKAKQNDKDVLMMRVMAPIGVYLPTGVALEIDGAAVGRVPFTRCRPQICEAFAEASPETLAKMKKGTAANFIIYEAPGLGIPMKISLDGFGASLTALNAQ